MFVIATFASIAVLAALMILATTALNTESAYATTIPKKDPGASGFSPGEEPQIPGWDPDRAEEDAPGQEAEIPVPQPPVPGPPTEIPPVPCDNCAKDLSPGQEALEAGVIGPDLKK